VFLTFNSVHQKSSMKTTPFYCCKLPHLYGYLNFQTLRHIQEKKSVNSKMSTKKYILYHSGSEWNLQEPSYLEKWNTNTRNV